MVWGRGVVGAVTLLGVMMWCLSTGIHHYPPTNQYTPDTHRPANPHQRFFWTNNHYLNYGYKDDKSEVS